MRRKQTLPREARYGVRKSNIIDELSLNFISDFPNY